MPYFRAFSGAWLFWRKFLQHVFLLEAWWDLEALNLAWPCSQGNIWIHLAARLFYYNLESIYNTPVQISRSYLTAIMYPCSRWILSPSPKTLRRFMFFTNCCLYHYIHVEYSSLCPSKLLESFTALILFLTATNYEF